MFDRIARLVVPDALETDGLRVVFRIEKSLVGYPNLANIKLYNLSANSRARIEKEGLKVQLFAGYADTGSPLLFDGDIVNVIHQKAGVDWISEIFAADGVNILSTSTVNKTLAAGADTELIYNTLIAEMEGIKKGVTEGIQNCLTGKRSLLRALQLSGNVKDWLDLIAKDCGFEYSVNDGVIETTAKGFPLSDEPPAVINQSGGMIGSPERTEIGITVKNLLLPALKLGRTIRVESISEKLNVGNLFFRKVPPVRNQGIYRIDKMIHQGDTHSNQWETQIQGRVF